MEMDFQKIYNTMVDYVPKQWERLAIFFAIVDNMFEFKYFVDSGEGYVDCFSLKEYKSTPFNILAFKIKKILSSERNNLPKEKQWSVFTMFVQSSGKFQVDYMYDDISENLISYREEWEEKHINKG